MMRIDLPQPLGPGDDFVEFSDRLELTTINDDPRRFGRQAATSSSRRTGTTSTRSRSGSRAWRVHGLDQGWQHKQFLGRGEFTLEFGDYVVRDHGARRPRRGLDGRAAEPGRGPRAWSGERLERPHGSETPVFIVTPEEAEENEAIDAERHEDVGLPRRRTCVTSPGPRRASSSGTRRCCTTSRAASTVMAMSYYPNGGRAALEPLLDARDRPHARRLLEVHLPLPVPGGDLGQRPGRRHGVPDDLLQRPAPGRGRDVHGSAPSTG